MNKPDPVGAAPCQRVIGSNPAQPGPLLTESFFFRTNPTQLLSETKVLTSVRTLVPLLFFMQTKVKR